MDKPCNSRKRERQEAYTNFIGTRVGRAECGGAIMLGDVAKSPSMKISPQKKRLRHWRSLCSKKPTVGFFVARNLRFSTAKQSKIAVFSRKAKTSGVSTKCIFAFDSPPFFI